jgi:hypothetical protein
MLKPIDTDPRHVHPAHWLAGVQAKVARDQKSPEPCNSGVDAMMARRTNHEATPKASGGMMILGSSLIQVFVARPVCAVNAVARKRAGIAVAQRAAPASVNA